ncbi:MAG: thioredoxin [Candidatus Saccharimonas sp.]
MALLKTSSKQEFQDKVLGSSKTVLVDFWAAWCPPCRAMAPILEEVAGELDSTVDIVKIDIEETPENNQLASDNGVHSIPNMVIFKGGKEVGRIIGLTQRLSLIDKLNKISTAA